MASPSESVPMAVNTFTLALLNKLSDGDETASIISSPLSISAALSMVMLGARGDTEKQMAEALCFGKPGHTGAGKQHQQSIVPVSGGDDIHAAFGELLDKIDDTKAVSIANRLFGEQSFRFVQKYIEDTKRYYRAELEAMDFEHNSEAARVKINTWVEEKTENKIKDLLKKGMVTPQTRLVLVNAIYFKAKWEKSFTAKGPSDGKFRISKKDTKSVKMMSQTNSFPFKQIPGVGIKVLEMPYKGRAFSMLVLLPDDIKDGSTGLEKLEEELQGPGANQKFEDWTNGMTLERIDLKLPKFRVEASYQLKDVLEKMGMVDVFSLSKCDLAGISQDKGLFVSKVVHKAYVAVDEGGTEAAAATAVVDVVGSPLVFNQINFNADHPFLFFIRHVPTKTVVFAGRFCGPE